MKSGTRATAPGKKQRWLRRIGLGVAILAALGGVGGVAGWWYLRASLPTLDGQRPLPGLTAPTRVERDSLGVPTVWAETTLDAIRALAFLHAQDRFFQMDVLRRRAAGELAELLGERAVEWDTAARLHRFRTRATHATARLPLPQAQLLQAYAQGVNAGMAALRRPPFEYALLRVSPQPWRAEDSILVVLAMFMELHDAKGVYESSLGVLYHVLPAPLAEFLDARGGEWDAPLTGDPFPVPPIPPPQVFDLRTLPTAASQPLPGGVPEPLAAGSNNWAVAGPYTVHGGALVANDMHLNLTVPNTWYRASLVWPDEEGQVRVTGVTLPGTPLVVAGSNGHVAWGFTNAYGDFTDLVILEEGETASTYRTPEGVRGIEKITEIVRVKGGEDRTLVVEETIWGPLLDRDHLGRRRALRWTAHDPEAVNLGLLELATARYLDEALDIANRTGIPPQNFVAADHTGRIGWTIMGRIPRRLGCDGRRPASWADGFCRWDGFLSPAQAPRVVDPPTGRIWTANARVVDGAMLALLGDGGYASGARAQQIRDALLKLERAREADMLAVQLDDRALFLAPWRERLLATLTPEVLAARPRLEALRRLVEGWSGRASIDDAGYTFVRAFRQKVMDLALAPLLASCRQADPRFRAQALAQQVEGPVVRLLKERPAHLLDPRFASWDELLLTAASEAVASVAGNAKDLTRFTWGRRNTLVMAHPLSRALPGLRQVLDMPRQPLPGDGHMPRVQSPDFGASQRAVVSPGREEQGIFHMPGGQSGHPLSPFYRAGHADWARGEPSPFLPGKVAHTLILTPTP